MKTPFAGHKACHARQKGRTRRLLRRKSMRRKAKRPSPGQEICPSPKHRPDMPPPARRKHTKRKAKHLAPGHKACHAQRKGRTCPRLLGGNIRSGKQNILPRGTKPAMRSGKAGHAAACLGGMEQRQSGRRKGKHEKQRAQRHGPGTAQKAPGGRRAAGLHQAAGNGEHNEHPCKATGNIHP